MSTLRPSEVAAKLKLSKKTTYQLMADGTIPAVRIGGQWRISETALERLINGGEGVEGGEGKTEGQTQVA